MWTADRVVSELERRGDLWQVAPGVIGMRGDLLVLHERMGVVIAAAALEAGCEPWDLPPALPPEVLERADYFTSFPQWLTFASHLPADLATLERVAGAAHPAQEARRSLEPAAAVLPPALCYHVYAELAGQRMKRPFRMTARGTCWRHEAPRLAPLERGWSFTMREVVCVGAGHEIESFRAEWIGRAQELASALGLDARLAAATDPFFAPTGGGKALLQRIKGLKHELLLPTGARRRTAAASFNNHGAFFGEAFGIRLADEAVAHTGCVAFGLERWTLAFLVAHGCEARHWPEVRTFGEPPVRRRGSGSNGVEVDRVRLP
jgi:seryl-tRNA synthetase